jgi:hypothetical protein
MENVLFLQTLQTWLNHKLYTNYFVYRKLNLSLKTSWNFRFKCQLVYTDSWNEGFVHTFQNLYKCLRPFVIFTDIANLIKPQTVHEWSLNGFLQSCHFYLDRKCKMAASIYISFEKCVRNLHCAHIAMHNINALGQSLIGECIHFIFICRTVQYITFYILYIANWICLAYRNLLYMRSMKIVNTNHSFPFDMTMIRTHDVHQTNYAIE